MNITWGLALCFRAFFNTLLFHCILTFFVTWPSLKIYFWCQRGFGKEQKGREKWNRTQGVEMIFFWGKKMDFLVALQKNFHLVILQNTTLTAATMSKFEEKMKKK